MTLTFERVFIHFLFSSLVPIPGATRSSHHASLYVTVVDLSREEFVTPIAAFEIRPCRLLRAAFLEMAVELRALGVASLAQAANVHFDARSEK